MEAKEKDITAIARQLRAQILRVSYQAKVGHVGSALSIADILAVLYFKILKIDPANPNWLERDRFLLSKGHAAAALYAVLCARGFFSKTELDTFCQNGSRLGVHPEDTSLPGIELATGSLGHGLSHGAGLALAGKQGPCPFRVFAILSDAECNEGSVWEAAMFAHQHKLDNLTAIIDYNKMQALGRTKDILQLEPFLDKWRAFGWEAQELDGHNLSEMEQSLSHLPLRSGKPTVFIAHTLVGKGISFMEDKLEWHYLTMSEKVFKEATREVGFEEAV